MRVNILVKLYVFIPSSPMTEMGKNRLEKLHHKLVLLLFLLLFLLPVKSLLRRPWLVAKHCDPVLASRETPCVGYTLSLGNVPENTA